MRRFTKQATASWEVSRAMHTRRTQKEFEQPKVFRRRHYSRVVKKSCCSCEWKLKAITGARVASLHRHGVGGKLEGRYLAMKCKSTSGAKEDREKGGGGVRADHEMLKHAERAPLQSKGRGKGARKGKSGIKCLTAKVIWGGRSTIAFIFSVRAAGRRRETARIGDKQIKKNSKRTANVGGERKEGFKVTAMPTSKNFKISGGEGKRKNPGSKDKA